jgi:hypothetical protein
MTNFFIFRHSSLLSPSIAASQLCLCNHEKGQQWAIEQQQPKIFQVGRYPARVYAIEVYGPYERAEATHKNGMENLQSS